MKIKGIDTLEGLVVDLNDMTSSSVVVGRDQR
jgi:hypothetical protein